MIDVTNISDVKMGDTVTIIGKDKDECISVDEMGSMLNTIGYEIVCDIGNRVNKVYVNESPGKNSILYD